MFPKTWLHLCGSLRNMGLQFSHSLCFNRWKILLQKARNAQAVETTAVKIHIKQVCNGSRRLGHEKGGALLKAQAKMGSEGEKRLWQKLFYKSAWWPNSLSYYPSPFPSSSPPPLDSFGYLQLVVTGKEIYIFLFQASSTFLVPLIEFFLLNLIITPFPR